MDENELAAALGRKTLEFDKLNQNYSNLLCFLGSVVSGEVERSRVLVNLTDRTYLWVAKGESPGMPATINGVPVCIVAPPGESSFERTSGEPIPTPILLEWLDRIKEECVANQRFDLAESLVTIKGEIKQSHDTKASLAKASAEFHAKKRGEALPAPGDTYADGRLRGSPLEGVNADP